MVPPHCITHIHNATSAYKNKILFFDKRKRRIQKTFSHLCAHACTHERARERAMRRKKMEEERRRRRGGDSVEMVAMEDITCDIIFFSL